MEMDLILILFKLSKDKLLIIIQTLLSMTLRNLQKQNKFYNKPYYYLQLCLIFLLEIVEHGRGFYYLVHLEQVKHYQQKQQLPLERQPFLMYRLLLQLPNGGVSLKNQLDFYLKWLNFMLQQQFLQMKLTVLLQQEVINKIKLVVE